MRRPIKRLSTLRRHAGLQSPLPLSTAPHLCAWLRGNGGRFDAVTQPYRPQSPDSSLPWPTAPNWLTLLGYAEVASSLATIASLLFRLALVTQFVRDRFCFRKHVVVRRPL